MKTLKISHSILSAWKEGRQEDAVAYYLGKDIPATDAMELGRLYDKKWCDYVELYKQLPDELGADKLANPRTQIKYQLRIPFSKEYEFLLRGVPDILTDSEIIDLKCGRTEATSYVGKMQLDYYSLFKPEIKTGKYICFNPYTNQVTIGIKFLNQDNRDNALEEIITYGAELLQYLLFNKLFIDYKENNHGRAKH